MSGDESFLSDPSEAKLESPAQPLRIGSTGAKTMQLAAEEIGDSQVTPAANRAAMDEMAKQEFLWRTHEYLGQYARFGDTKAAFAGTIATALLGGLYTADAFVPVVGTSIRHWSLATWFAVLSGVFLLLCVALAIWTVLPRGIRGDPSKGFVYWGSIAAHGKLEYLETSFHSQSARTLNDHLLHQIFDVSSKVCVPKYRCVSLCLRALVIGGFLAAAALVLGPRK